VLDAVEALFAARDDEFAPQRELARLDEGGVVVHCPKLVVSHPLR
jgi:hypothetical protein